MKIKRTELLFSFKGRIQRLYFWITSVVVGVVAGMATTTFQFAAESFGMGEINPETNEFEPTGPFAIAIFAVALANMWINFALCVKRLHDRDRTGWWTVAQTILIVVAVLLFVVAITLPEGERTAGFVPAGIVGAAAVGLTFWLFVEIGCLRGTRGSNRYGPDPLDDATGQTPSDAKL
jgi:uncharacterized membrane protein YhaH (DUF805 family)